MALEPYRRLLSVPGVRSLLLVGTVARIPATATGITLTLHVVNGLGLGFAQAGLAAMASAIGTAVGSPLAGRFVDRRGLRPVVLVTSLAQLAFWATAWALPFPALLAATALAGLLSLPLFSVLKQCVAAMVPLEQRRLGYSLDSILIELSYMTGPALGVLGVTLIGSTWTMCVVGVGLVGAGAALFFMNPPVRSDEEAEEAEEMAQAGEKVSRRRWLTPAVAGLLGTVCAATFVLTTTELALVATMKQSGDTAWTGLAIGVWCAYSLVGGLVYGGLSRGFSPLLLIGAMGVLTVPVGLVGDDWRWLMIALLPAGVLCAPGLSATVDTLSRWVPAGARGEAMGLHGTALLIGGAASAPMAGALIDSWGPGWAFAVAGLVGVAMVLLALPFWRRTGVPAEGSVPVSV
ncbi:MFS transporter [Streptosporangium saharense]|uniref:MFS family permease n=1 Tax=Streptosporangium saharense TaxID=1706840 RepID=A0A7W7QM09_9ACTN|nr:MFS transporter [Streptosporangium saharense]MBB4916087.1 MFS family permease [Streptosporangium saharense]